MLKSVLTLALGASLFAFPSARAADTWKTGTAKQSITPSAPMWMAGYGSRNHPATGLLNDLWAKALVLEDAHSQRAVIVTLDLVGISPDVTGPLRVELEQKYGLSGANVVFCCSHTHSGPVVGTNLRSLHYDQVDDQQRQLIIHYASDLRKTIVKLVGRAIDNLAPSEISWGQGTATFAVNRRNNKEPDAPQLRAAGKLAGPIDHDVPVLKVTDPAGKLTAVLFGYACHATVLDGYDWSSDYPGFAQSELEEKHPGCTALFVAGCGADQNPLPRRKVELARQYGHDLATAVDAVLEKKLPTLAPELQTAASEVSLELAHVPSREEIEKDAESTDRFVSARARWYRHRLASGEQIASRYPYPIQVWRLGSQLTFITLGGEVVVDFAIRLKQQYGPHTWVAGYSNDVMAYIPSRRVLTEGGYEGAGAMVYYSLPSPWSPTVEETIIEGVGWSMRRVK